MTNNYNSMSLYKLLQQHSSDFHNVVPFTPTEDKLLLMDFTSANTTLTMDILNDTDMFSIYVQKQLATKYKYGIGGYNEHRTIYARSEKFDTADEPRRLHLGIDIWGDVGTPIFAPLDGTVHSFAFNNFYGDYGATIILQHSLEGYTFHTLYGHLSLRDIENLKHDQVINKGQEFAHFGPPKENGYWPAHLHFQIIDHFEGKKGDYKGVCKFSEREKWLANCPDPDVILRMMQYAKKDRL
jgi:murein DD-endopeptidase MepM/ murein hydrolase activator NlpD